MRLVDDVNRALDRAHYDLGYEIWRACMASFDWYLDSGRFGSATDPGISDLDCVLIVKDGTLAEAISAHRAWVASQNDESRFLFFHDPVFVPQAGSAVAGRLHTVVGLQWDRGHGYWDEDVPAESKLYTNLVWTLFMMPLCSRIVRKSGVQSLRGALSYLKNLHYSEAYWTAIVGGNLTARDPLSISRDLRRAVVRREIGLADLTRVIRDEFEASLVRLSSLLDLFGENLTSTPGQRNFRGAHKKVVTKSFGEISAGPRTIIDSRADHTMLHNAIFDLTFDQGSVPSRYSRAAEEYWAASARMKAVLVAENIPPESFFPKPFNYQPGIDDVDLDSHEFACIEMPTAITSKQLGGGRASIGEAGHLVYGPYVRIKREGRYCVALTYATTACPKARAGILEVAVSWIDEQGEQVGWDVLGQVDLVPTGGSRSEGRIEFNTTGCRGALLETRVFVEAGAEMNAFRVRTWRSDSATGLERTTPVYRKGMRFPPQLKRIVRRIVIAIPKIRTGGGGK